MGKVRYKKPSEIFEKNSSKNENSSLRVSIGKDQAIKEYYYLNTGNLIPYEKQARRVFIEEELEQLAETIRQHGIRSPLTVMPSQKQTGKFEVVSGERRLKAAKIASLKKVPCIIINDEETAEEIALIENIQRTDLHPIELGEALASLLTKKGWGDITRLAEKIGKSQPTVSEHLSYSKLPESIKTYLIEQNIRSRETLRRLLNTPNIEQMELILGIKQQERVTNTKSILRISMNCGDIHIQDKKIFKLEKVQRDALKLSLLNIIRKLEELE